MVLYLIKNILEAAGYKVEVGSKVEGLSGVIHDFDILAYKGETTLGIITGGEDFHVSYVVSLVKALDIKNTCVILLIEKKYAKSESKSFKNFHLLVYDDQEDLERKLKELINVCENSSGKYE
mgnify:CR=1 FL=1